MKISINHETFIDSDFVIAIIPDEYQTNTYVALLGHLSCGYLGKVKVGREVADAVVKKLTFDK